MARLAAGSRFTPPTPQPRARPPPRHGLAAVTMSRLEAAMSRLEVLPKAEICVPVHRVETTEGLLRVSVDLPLLSNAEAVILDLQPTGLHLAEPAVGYALDLTFACTVDEGGAVAKFDKKARVLLITLPVVSSGLSSVAEADVHIRRTWVGRFDKLQKRFPDAPKQSIIAALTEHEGHEGKAGSHLAQTHTDVLANPAPPADLPKPDDGQEETVPTMRALVHAARPFAEHVGVLRELGVAVATLELEPSHFDDCTYVNAKPAGVSLCFDGPPPAAERRLACIHLFSGGLDGYSRCALELPCGLGFDMVGKDVVERLGEPDKKGGGGKAPLLLVYQGLGLQVTIAATDWNRGQSSPVEAIDVFAPASGMTCEPKDAT